MIFIEVLNTVVYCLYTSLMQGFLVIDLYVKSNYGLKLLFDSNQNLI